MNPYTDVVKKLLLSTERKGIKKLIIFLDEIQYFNCPASIKDNGNYKGGLVHHSYNVYERFSKFVNSAQLNIDNNSIILCSFLHDLIDVFSFVYSDNCIRLNKTNPYTFHAKSSIQIIKKFIELTEQEKRIILYHMGYYGSRDLLGAYRGEYSLIELSEINRIEPITEMFYMANNFVTQFIDKNKRSIK